MVNGVNSSTNAAYTTAYSSSSKTKASEAATEKKNETGVVYEKSNATYKKSNSAVIEQLKKDSQTRISQMQDLVSKMFKDQGIKIGTADDMWKTLASGNFTADAATIAQAKEDISENGYWGVKQTSDRIFDFAMALSGGDEKTMEKMKAAVEKGFQLATKSWGKELPGISNDTYSAVMDKFDNFFKNGVEE